MNYYLDAVTYLSTGIKAINTGFPVKELEILVTQKTGESNVNLVRSSQGVSDGTYQLCHTQYMDGTATGAGAKRFTDRIVNVRERQSGTVNDVLVAVIDDTLAPWDSTNAYIIITTANPNYQLTIKARG